jgi:SAM-dependent methyltransferase
MGLTGPEFYDDESLFATYVRKRGRVDCLNDVLEKPIFDELTGNLAGLRILDLGCGYAGFGQEALRQGCRSYLGIDGAQRMVDLARHKLAGTPGKVVRATIETWDYPLHQFDLVASRFALHYVEELEPVFALVYRALVAGGRLVFSVEHPVVTCGERDKRTGGWIVDRYFETGPRVTSWLGGQGIKVHRTIEDYFGALARAGFVVNAVRESRPRRSLFAKEVTYQGCSRIPLILFFSAAVPS